MASIIMDAPSKLGEYMLKGWVLTDDTCSNEGCPIPLLRSPKGREPEIYFCARCEGEPKMTGLRDTPSHKTVGQPSSPEQASSSASNLTNAYSRSSTPATDLPSPLESPTFVPPPPTAETLRRRQQSDAAAAEIGSRLLKGWAMLADECPSSSCYGIPLVRPPRSSDENGTKKECVACGTVYIDEGQGLTPMKSGGDTLGTASTSDSLPTSKHLQPVPRSAVNRSQRLTSSIKSHLPTPGMKSPPFNDENIASSIDDATTSLSFALRSLSNRLTIQSSNADGMDVISMGNTVDAIDKVLTVLNHIESFRHQS